MAKASLKEEGGYRPYLLLGECQLVVFGINTTPTGIPNLEYREGNYSVKTAQLVLQLSYEAAWL